MGLKELEDRTAGAVVSGWQSHDCGAQRNKCNQKRSIHTRTIVQTAVISWLPSPTLRSWRRLFLGLMDILRASSVSSQRLPSTSVCSGCSMHGMESGLSFTTKNSHIHTTKVIARRVGKLNCLNPVESAAVLLCFFFLTCLWCLVDYSVVICLCSISLLWWNGYSVQRQPDHSNSEKQGRGSGGKTRHVSLAWNAHPLGVIRFSSDGLGWSKPELTSSWGEERQSKLCGSQSNGRQSRRCQRASQLQALSHWSNCFGLLEMKLRRSPC